MQASSAKRNPPLAVGKQRVDMNTVYRDVKREFEAAGHTEEPPFWIAKSAGFDGRKLPSEMGHAFAVVW